MNVPVYLGIDVDESKVLESFCKKYECSHVMKILVGEERIDYGLIIYEWNDNIAEKLEDGIVRCLAYHAVSSNGCTVGIGYSMVAELVAYDRPAKDFLYEWDDDEGEDRSNEVADTLSGGHELEDVRSAVESGMDSAVKLSRGGLDTILMSLSLDKCTVERLAKLAGGTGERRFGLAIAEVVRRVMERLGGDAFAYKRLAEYDTLGKCGETNVVKVKLSLEDRDMLRRFALMIGPDVGISKAVRTAVSYFVEQIDKGSLSRVEMGGRVG